MNRLTALAAILFLWAGIYLPGLGSLELKGEEPRRSLPAIAMLDTGDWLVPHLNGKPYLNKPPLVNWLIAGSMRLMGRRNELAARLPSVLVTLALALTLVWTGSRWLGTEGGFCAAVFFLTSVAFVEKGRLAEIEADYVALTGMAFAWWLAAWANRETGWRLWLVPQIFLGLGLLAKGPTHLLLFYAVIVPVLFGAREQRQLWSFAHFTSLALAAAIFAAWFVPYHLATAHLHAESVWVDQIKERVGGGSLVLREWLPNIPRALSNGLPWILFAPLWWSRRVAGGPWRSVCCHPELAKDPARNQTTPCDERAQSKLGSFVPGYSQCADQVAVSSDYAQGDGKSGAFCGVLRRLRMTGFGTLPEPVRADCQPPGCVPVPGSDPERLRVFIQSARWPLAICFVGLMLIPGMLPRYTLPLYPAGCLLFALVAGQLSIAHRVVWSRCNRGLLLLILSVSISGPWILFRDTRWEPWLPVILTLGLIILESSPARAAARERFGGTQHRLTAQRLAAWTGLAVASGMILFAVSFMPHLRLREEIRSVGNGVNRALPPTAPLYVIDHGYDPAIFYIRRICFFVPTVRELPFNAAYALVCDAERDEALQAFPGRFEAERLPSKGKKSFFLLKPAEERLKSPTVTTERFSKKS